jgi:hypothetical protein
MCPSAVLDRSLRRRTALARTENAVLGTELVKVKRLVHTLAEARAAAGDGARRMREGGEMTTREALLDTVKAMSEDEVREVLDFARFVTSRAERREWSDFGLGALERAYGPDEPEYAEADVERAGREGRK